MNHRDRITEICLKYGLACSWDSQASTPYIPALAYGCTMTVWIGTIREDVVYSNAPMFRASVQGPVQIINSDLAILKFTDEATPPGLFYYHQRLAHGAHSEMDTIQQAGSAGEAVALGVMDWAKYYQEGQSRVHWAVVAENIKREIDGDTEC